MAPATWVLWLAALAFLASWAAIRIRRGPDPMNWLGAIVAAALAVLAAALAAALLGIPVVQ